MFKKLILLAFVSYNGEASYVLDPHDGCHMEKTATVIEELSKNQ
jgi:hypothetical protein